MGKALGFKVCQRRIKVFGFYPSANYVTEIRPADSGACRDGGQKPKPERVGFRLGLDAEERLG